MHTFHAKASVLCASYYLHMSEIEDTTLVESISYMFAEINVFTGLNTKIDVGKLPE